MTTVYFDEGKWDSLLSNPLWYAGSLWDEYEALMHRASQDTEHGAAIKHAIRTYFADRLDHGLVALAGTGENMDAARKPIDTVVVHHTSGSASNYTLSYLNAVQLLRLYVPPYRTGESHQGQSIWSGHFYEGQQIFWGYHWFVFENGAYARILPDAAIGWHSGNWDMNTRSVGICLAGNFMEQSPNPAMLGAIRQIIATHYANPAIRIIGHYETPRNTACPGATFDRWRDQLRG